LLIDVNPGPVVERLGHLLPEHRNVQVHSLVAPSDDSVPAWLSNN